MKIFKTAILTALLAALGCSAPEVGLSSESRLIPAEEFTKSVRAGGGEQFSIYRTHSKEAPAGASAPAGQFSGDPRYLAQGYTLKRSAAAPQTIPVSDSAPEAPAPVLPQQPSLRTQNSVVTASLAPYPPGPPPGSSSPYFNGQMTANPSLWPDEGQGASLFRDFRAVQAMDIVTIVINDSTMGKRKADTDSKSKFSLVAGIANFFGLETSKWASNNEALDPAQLINATTDTQFKGEGETKREGTLKAKLSAVILEVLPTGLLRIEGTKIISVNSEEEIMVISGLVRPRDVDSSNQVDSSRIANLRVDLYGRGVLADQQQPGWGSKVFEAIWPF